MGLKMSEIQRKCGTALPSLKQLETGAPDARREPSCPRPPTHQVLPVGLYYR